MMDDFHDDHKRTVASIKDLDALAEGYEKRVKEESELTKEQLKTRYVGRVDPKKREFSLVAPPPSPSRSTYIALPRRGLVAYFW